MNSHCMCTNHKLHKLHNRLLQASVPPVYQRAKRPLKAFSASIYGAGAAVAYRGEAAVGATVPEEMLTNSRRVRGLGSDGNTITKYVKMSRNDDSFNQPSRLNRLYECV